MGTAKNNAVKADNCCGERFFVLNIPLTHEGEFIFAKIVCYQQFSAPPAGDDVFTFQIYSQHPLPL